MRNRFGFALLFGLIASTLLSAQITITDTGEGGGKKPSPEKPLTDDDIIRMVRAGKTEASIVAAIRASRKSFDLSPQGCRALNQARVSGAVLNAMGDGSHPACGATLDAAKPQTTSGNDSRNGMLTPGQSGAMLSNSPSAQPAANGPGKLLNNKSGSPTLMGDGSKQAPAAVATPSNGSGRVALNPQPLPPRTAANATTGASSGNAGAKVSLNPQPLPPKTAGPSTQPMKLKAGSLTASAVVKNTLVSKSIASMTAQLQSQRQSADQEASQMKLSLRTASSPGTLNNRAATSGTKIQNTSSVGSLGPAKTMASGSMSGVSATVAHLNDLPIICAQDPTMRIVRVSGKSTPATFTPDSQFNFYTIAGCSFGDPGPNAKVYIYFQNTFHQDFQVQQWNDTGIQLQLDNNLSGVLDQDNVTLVVQRADGKQATKNGFKFYAARETKLLSKILEQDFSLQHFTTNDISKLTDQYFSPSDHGASSGFPAGWSAAVSWNLTFANLQADEDVYTFSHVAPGFVPDSAQAAQIDIDCGNKPWMQRTGKFGLNWDDKGYLHVQWQGQGCTEQMQGVMGTKGDTFYSAGANYVVKVWVTGPRGIDPLSGKAIH